MSLRLVLCVGAALLLVGVAMAEVPQMLNYQGRLVDGGGQPVTVPVNVVFALWNAETDGDSLWSEPRVITPDGNGSFITLLGAVSPIPDSAFAGQAFLSVKVEADPEMSPRAQIVSVGYAYRVGSLAGAAGGGITGSVIVVNPTGDSTIIGADQIVIRGAGGDEEQVYCSSSGISVTDQNGDVRINISIDEDGPGITLYESSTLARGTQDTGARKVEFREGGVLLFGTSDLDTVCHLLPDGNIVGKGRLAMGQNHASSGVWANVLGYDNEATGDSSVVSGGYNNTASGGVSVVAGGAGNVAGDLGAVVSGGILNHANGNQAVVAGGYLNYAANDVATISGGSLDTASGLYATIAGGSHNVASSDNTTISGGLFNRATGSKSTIGGGWNNTTTGALSTISGGQKNNTGTLLSDYASIGGGCADTASGYCSVIGGGYINTASASYATVPGGRANTAAGQYSLAAGRRAKANHDGTFVWADDTDADFTSSASDQFLIRAAGGVGINTNSPNVPLHVVGGSDVTLSSGGYVTVGSAAGRNITLDDNEIMARYNGAAENLVINRGSGDVFLCDDGTGSVGIGTISPSYPLDVNGDIECTTVHETSDARFKSEIAPITGALATVGQLRGVTHTWNRDEYPERQFDDKAHLGFLAQEIQDIVPELVSPDADGYLAVDYSHMAPLLVEAIKELKTQNETKDARIDQLETKLAELQVALERLLADRK